MLKSKHIVILLGFTLVLVVVSVTVTSKSNLHPGTLTTTNSQSAQHQELPGTIDGGKTPDLIPDHVAYSALFRLLSNRRTEDEAYRARAYVKQMGLGTHRCRSCPPELSTAESDVDVVLASAEEFYQRINALDQQVAEIKQRNWPNPSGHTMAALTVLQQQREAVAIQIAVSLAARLTPKGMERVRRYINEHVKQRVKLIPEPTTPPGGTGWHPAHVMN